MYHILIKQMFLDFSFSITIRDKDFKLYWPGLHTSSEGTLSQILLFISQFLFYVRKRKTFCKVVKHHFLRHIKQKVRHE